MKDKDRKAKAAVFRGKWRNYNKTKRINWICDVHPSPHPPVLLSAEGGGVRGEDAVRLPWFQPCISWCDGQQGWVCVCVNRDSSICEGLWREDGEEEERRGRTGGEEEREDRRKEVLKGGGGLMSLQRVVVSSELQKSKDDKKLHFSIISPSSLLHQATFVSAHGQLKERRRPWSREGRSEGDTEGRIKRNCGGGMEGVWVFADPLVSLVQILSCFTCSFLICQFSHTFSVSLSSLVMSIKFVDISPSHLLLFQCIKKEMAAILDQMWEQSSTLFKLSSYCERVAEHIWNPPEGPSSNRNWFCVIFQHGVHSPKSTLLIKQQIFSFVSLLKATINQILFKNHRFLDETELIDISGNINTIDKTN